MLLHSLDRYITQVSKDAYKFGPIFIVPNIIASLISQIVKVNHITLSLTLEMMS